MELEYSFSGAWRSWTAWVISDSPSSAGGGGGGSGSVERKRRRE